MNAIDLYESEVRSYCRHFPVTFDRAEGSRLYAEDGTAYLDFLAGAGALNYGHNPAPLREALIAYLQRGGIVHSLDLYTRAKREFLETFHRVILQPRELDYRVQFPGPTGTNAVEASLKLARKVTGRERVIAFTNSFHGMTLGALAVTGNAFKRRGAGVSLNDSLPVPYDGYLGEETDTLAYLEALLDDSGSGVDKPAAVIVETVQAEGGINVAHFDWLKRLSALLKRHGVLLIVDDIQVGCGRTGPFFSFEPAGLQPDIVCLSKSLSGYGLPLSVVLMKPEHDLWAPGEHNGTFRGHNPAFVTAKAALELWRDSRLTDTVAIQAADMRRGLEAIVARHAPLNASLRGRGLIQGLAFTTPAHAQRVAQECFARGLVIETAGAESQVLKLLPPLTVTPAELAEGLQIIDAACATVASAAGRRRSAA